MAGRKTGQRKPKEQGAFTEGRPYLAPPVLSSNMDPGQPSSAPESGPRSERLWGLGHGCRTPPSFPLGSPNLTQAHILEVPSAPP